MERKHRKKSEVIGRGPGPPSQMSDWPRFRATRHVPGIILLFPRGPRPPGKKVDADTLSVTSSITSLARGHRGAVNGTQFRGRRGILLGALQVQ